MTITTSEQGLPHPQTNLLIANLFCPLSTRRGEGAVLLAIAKEDEGEA